MFAVETLQTVANVRIGQRPERETENSIGEEMFVSIELFFRHDGNDRSVLPIDPNEIDVIGRIFEQMFQRVQFDFLSMFVEKFFVIDRIDGFVGVAC